VGLFHCTPPTRKKLVHVGMDGNKTKRGEQAIDFWQKTVKERSKKRALGVDGTQVALPRRLGKIRRKGGGGGASKGWSQAGLNGTRLNHKKKKWKGRPRKNIGKNDFQKKK